MVQGRESSPPTMVARVRFRPGAIGGLSLLLVLALLRGFFSGIFGFLPSTKTNISKFQFDQDRGPAWKPAKADVAYSLNIVIYFILFIYLFSYLFICHWRLTLRRFHINWRLKEFENAPSWLTSASIQFAVKNITIKKVYCLTCLFLRRYVCLLFSFLDRFFWC